ncbi:hypothetical protein F383_33644 [Gossypium arboreum]|uniref:Uncharacterized protein n=1 Tax=Gossypium arboreum TaxID=29729 RepID=A0A0B0PNG1_GOSAR|nr:hypothetical protein F383_31606 [Gossypium arboreum]KHG26540.1 hypothetical protein F383_33644 [Gossypium arboreum]
MAEYTHIYISKISFNFKAKYYYVNTYTYTRESKYNIICIYMFTLVSYLPDFK